MVGRSIEQVETTLPRGVRIGAVLRGPEGGLEVLMPAHDLVIETDDHLILFIPQKRQVREVERMFQVSATFF